MKKFLLKIFPFVIYALLLQVVFPVIVDPFNVFHFENMRSNGVGNNGNYIKMKYLLNHPDKFNAFIFGSSRVGALHPEKMPGRTYNMTYGQGIPVEYAANIRTFLQNNIRLARIYVGVDSLSYGGSLEEQIMQPGRCPYEYLRDNPSYFYSLYLNPMDTLRSLWINYTSELVEKEEYNYDVYFNFGYRVAYNQKTKYVWKDDKYISPTIGYRMDIEATLNDIKEIVDMCRDNGVELILFTNPMHRLTYIASIKKKAGPLRSK